MQQQYILNFFTKLRLSTLNSCNINLTEHTSSLQERGKSNKFNTNLSGQLQIMHDGQRVTGGASLAGDPKRKRWGSLLGKGGYSI